MKAVILDPFSNMVTSIVAGQPSQKLAVCDMNKVLGSVLEKITLNLGGTFTPANIVRIELKANGKVIWTSTGERLKKTNAYFRTVDDVMLKIDFMDRSSRTVNGFQAGAIDLSGQSGITSLRLEVTHSNATDPTLAGWCDLTPPTNDPNESNIRFLIARRHEATVPISGANTFAIPVPHIDPAGGGSIYRRIYFHTNKMTAIKAIREGITEWELTVDQLAEAAKDAGRIPQAGLVVFDPTMRGMLFADLWDTRYDSTKGAGVRSAQLYATFSDAESVTVETEELLPLGAY